MTLFSCSCRENCTALSAVVALLLGVVAAFLQFSGTIAVTPVFLWVVLGIAVVYLAVILVTSAFAGENRIRSCLCALLPTVLTALLATVVLAILLLAIPPAAVIGAVLVGVLIAAFFLSLFATACIAKCVAGCAAGSEA